MAIQYKQNATYAPLVKASYAVGNLPSKKSVNINRYRNIPSVVSGTPSVVTTPYGGSTKFEKFHPGVDLAANIGSPVKVTVPGIVTEVVTGKKQGDPGYGNYVLITDAQGNKHRYSHLNRSYVRVGQPLAGGALLGEVGNTGQTYSVSGGSGSHLDYRILNEYGKYINPSSVLKKYNNIRT